MGAKALAETLLGSVKTHTPAPPLTAPHAAASASLAPIPASPLAEGLKGRKLLYLKTSNGFSDEEEVHLCSNGVAAIDGASSAMSAGAGGALTYAGQDSYKGTWTVKDGQVVVLLDGGARRSWPVSLRPDGSVDILVDNWWVQPQQWCE